MVIVVSTSILAWIVDCVCGRLPDEVQVTVSRYPAASLGLRGPLSSTQPFESTHTSPTLCVTYRTELVSFSWR